MKARPRSLNAIKRIALYARWTGAAAVIALMAGCASGPARTRRDPFEPFNRGVFRFNDGVDEAILQAGRHGLPRQRASAACAPASATSSATWTTSGTSRTACCNCKLQASCRQLHALQHQHAVRAWRAARHRDRGRHRPTQRGFRPDARPLGRAAGPYLVLPLLGPVHRARRVGAADRSLLAIRSTYVDGRIARGSLTVLRVVDTRADLLRASQLLDEAALDKYSVHARRLPAAPPQPTSTTAIRPASNGE